ncbi:MAG: HAD-IC family P-type ATPase [Clostridia bacterium]|nr:HAD-IC family P-type ATPase [Clostridia bacterium]
MEKENRALPTGLTTAEVERLTSEGRVNVSDIKSGKSYGRIVIDNLLTFFNLVWTVVAVILISFGSFDNLGFLAVVIPNAVIAIVQEMRAKRVVDKLSVTTEPRASVVRDGELIEIPANEIVLGDVMYVEMGRQVLSDGVVVEGLAEANESMLTGESDAIRKSEGDRVLAGSYLVSGGIYVKVTAVGKDNYITKIERAAKNFRAPQSNLFRDLNNLVKYIGIFMIPMTVIVAISNWFVINEGGIAIPEGSTAIAETIQKTSGAIIGMIPSGIYLLITLTLTLSVLLLAKKKTLVQDMYSIEMLASADVVCLDKTGTITDGTMTVTEVECLGGSTEEDIKNIMAYIEGSESSINATSRALIERFGMNTDCKILDKIPFSSARKYSAVSIEGVGTYAIGAPHFVKCPVSEALEDRISYHAAQGERVLLLVRQTDLTTEGEAIALIAIADRIRPNAKETIQKFQEQGVRVKVISGDNALTVSTIAKRVGILGADKYLSCEALSDDELLAVANDYDIYGRVSPEQKVLLVKAFKRAGHTVAMTGDGVNDTLALREADCSIAMADGSDVARKVSKIVLLESDFGTLPDVVREGRRAINNVRMSSVLFLMKTMLTIVLSIFAVIVHIGYPLEAKHLNLIELIIIGLASLALTVEPNNKRIEGSFIKTVLIKSIPNAISMLIPVCTILIMSRAGVITDSALVSALCMLTLTLAGFVNLIFICIPYTKWRVGVVAIVTVLLAVALVGSVLLLGDLWEIMPAINALGTLMPLLGVTVLCAVAVHLVRIGAGYFIKKKKA